MIRLVYHLSSIYKKANEAYEEFRDQVEDLSKSNPKPFDSWFHTADSDIYDPRPETGRIYIQFHDERSDSLSQEDQFVIGFLEEHGWIVTDYVGGYATKNNRVVRIGKIFPQIRKEVERAYDLELANTTDSFEKSIVEEKKEEELESIDDFAKSFSTSNTRAANEELLIVVSQNPHDIASMSTGRGWESCMTLGSGSHYKDVFCEVKRGGLVAYLIKDSDTNITKPIARIHIRRFVSLDGRNIAVPEDTVYGNDVPGFHGQVQDFINHMQGNITPGMYKREGGGYSDSFRDTEVFLSPYSSETELVSMLSSNKEPVTTYVVNDDYYDDYGYDDDEVEDLSATFYSQEEALNWIRLNSGYDDEGENRFSLSVGEKDLTYDFISKALSILLSRSNLSQIGLNALKNFALSHNDDGQWEHFVKTIVTSYPTLFSKEEFDSFNDDIKYKAIENLPQKEKDEYLASISESLTVSFNNPEMFFSFILPQGNIKELNPNERKNLEHKVFYLFMKIFGKPLTLIEKYSEKLIVALINFSKWMNEKGIDGNGVNNQILHCFGLKRADSPSVQKYIQEQLERWDSNYTANRVILYAIKGLRENGRGFLPFLYHALNKKQKTPANNNKEIESILHTIDIVSGKLSTKYRFTY